MGMIFCGWKLSLLSVERSTGGGEDYLAHPILDASLEEVDCSQEAHVGVEVRLAHGTPYVHLGCLVAECLWLELLEDLLASRADVCLVEMCPSGMFSRLPLERSSTMATSWWRPRSASAT